jgi:hypothetical protein
VIRPVGFNLWAVLVAAVVAFVASAAWYIAFSKQRATLSPAAAASAGRPQPTQILLELARNLVLAFVLAYLVRQINVTTATRAASLGLLLWIGFPFILLSGSVIYENVPWRLAAIHAGDWLIKLLLIPVIIGLWRR